MFSGSSFSSVRICCCFLFVNSFALSFGLLVEQNKTFADISLDCLEIITGIFHSFLTFYRRHYYLSMTEL